MGSGGEDGYEEKVFLPPHERAEIPGPAAPPPPELNTASSRSSAESRKLPASRYKGVVPQPNGRWGAQIYERHQRVWLGTFPGEAEAACAYDVAVQRFRGRDAITNFRPLSESDDDGASELAFLAAHSKAEIVDMLRKHTYQDELRQSRSRGANGLPRPAGRSAAQSSTSHLRSARDHLFDKELTPSDVGKLHRLVIPKLQAEKHFPLSVGGSTGAVLLNFEDGDGRVWRFRYSYWNSSQSYVLTKGWSRFVKEKGLKAGDVVSFWRWSEGPERQLLIGCSSRASAPAAGQEQVVRLFGVNIASDHGSGESASEGRLGGASGRSWDSAGR